MSSGEAHATEGPLVSVVLPTHNRSATLPRAIRSVLDQTYEHLELVVVDDASDDGTAELVRAFDDDARVQFLHLDTRGGPGRARNVGIRESAGELVAFQDSDDEWLPLKLERQVELLQSNARLGGVGGGYIMTGAPQAMQYRFPLLSAAAGYEAEVLEGACCITPVWLLRRAALADVELFDETLPSLEDWDLMLRLSDAIPLQCIFEPVLVKHAAADSLGWDIERRGPAMVELLERHGERWKRNPRLHAEYCLEVAYLQLLVGHRDTAHEFLTRAIKSGGVRPRPAAGFVLACARRLLQGGRAPMGGLSRDRHATPAPH
jgi:glycosyltransferase involved in cell wall biosynthesis